MKAIGIATEHRPLILNQARLIFLFSFFSRIAFPLLSEFKSIDCTNERNVMCQLYQCVSRTETTIRAQIRADFQQVLLDDKFHARLSQVRRRRWRRRLLSE